MADVTVKDKNAVVIPASVMRKARIKVGDLLAADAVVSGIEQGLDDIKNGRVYGPYASIAASKKAFDKRFLSG